MIARPVTWTRALRALAAAVAFVLLLAFALANFVLVDVRLWVVDVQMRLAWAVLGAAALGFACGALWTRSCGAVPAGASAVVRHQEEAHVTWPPAGGSAPAPTETRA